MLKKVIPAILVLVVVVAIGVFLFAGGTATQASDIQPTTPNQPATLQGVPNADDESTEPPEVKKVPFVGVALGFIPDDELAAQGLDNGVLVAEVVEDSPAEGILLDGDVITAINGDAVSHPKDIVETVHDSEPGEVLTFSVVREGESLDVDVTLGERDVEVRVFRNHGDFAMPGFPMLGQFGGAMMDKIIKAEVKVETDEGIKTFRAATGTVSNVDIDAGTFDLTLKDGSETISYRISEDTKIVLQHEGDLSGLDTDDMTFVVEVEDDAGERTVMVVAQGLQSGQSHKFHRFHKRDFTDGSHLRFFQGGPESLNIPEIREHFRMFTAPGHLEGDFQGRMFDMEQFLDNLPEGAEDYFDGLPFGPEGLETEKESIPEGSSL